MSKRPFCHGCEFPLRTCLCPALPPSPLHSLIRNCRIVVVQHPHEARKKNRSLPLVELCLFGNTKTDDEGVPNNDGGDDESVTDAIRKKTQDETTADESESTNATNGETTNDINNDNDAPPRRREYSNDFVMKTIIARRLGVYCDNDVMELLHDPNEVAVLVFPHEDALQLEDGLRLAEERCKSNNIDINRNNDDDDDYDAKAKKKMTLIFIDATWKYAKEMEKCTDSDNEWPENLIRVQLTPSSSSSSSSKVNLDGSDDGWKTPSLTTTTTTTSPFIERRFHIRTPPSSNHLCTAESIAWIVSRVERNPVIYDSIGLHGISLELING